MGSDHFVAALFSVFAVLRMHEEDLTKEESVVRRQQRLISTDCLEVIDEFRELLTLILITISSNWKAGRSK